MPSLEERMQALEHEHADLKQKIELHTLAIGGLVNKATLEAINEKNDKIFEALIHHDEFTNMQLAELREKVEVQLEGKIAGMHAEMRQRFTELDSRITGLDGKIVGQQTEMRQRFAEQDRKIASLDSRVSSLDSKFASLDGKFASLQATQAEHTTLLQQILARLPERW